jgi:Uma2 family endonuclease
VGETPEHVLNLLYLVELLADWFRNQARVFVAGNMFVYYEEGNRRRHVTPDVFLVRGISKVTDPPRRRYLLWEEKPIDFVVEMTSESTREEDQTEKLELYRDTLRVREYFLFDPLGEYLDPPLQGYRRSQGRYARIRPRAGRLPSKVLGLHLEAAADWLRLYDPATQSWVQMAPEARETLRQNERAIRENEQELERLRQENEELRRRLGELEQE